MFGREAQFDDRRDAGRVLAKELSDYAGRDDVLILALPRGGVPVAYEVARELNAPLDIFVVRKLGTPGHAEMAMGAIASGGVRVLNTEVIHALNIPTATIDRVVKKEQQVLRRRENLYRDDRPAPEIEGHTVILVDDGLATGATMRAAVKALHQRNPAKIVVAVPVSSPKTCAEFEDRVDDVICALTPQPFRAVGLWYRNFAQTTDEEVRNLLKKAAKNPQIESQ